jgi:hypothetical protein
MLDVYTLCYSLREKYGTVRVSTAYEFFEAVDKHLVLQPQDYSAREKPPFAATEYQIHYYAADENDERGKEKVSFTLNRKEKWNSSAVAGIQSHYEFVGLPPTAQGGCELGMRRLPCPCDACMTDNFPQCCNVQIVDTMTTVSITEKPKADCPDYLVRPLNNYVNATLKAFIKQYNNYKLPPKQSKPDLIVFINDKLSDYIINVREECNNV